jgi:site-specific recombinase XerC
VPKSTAPIGHTQIRKQFGLEAAQVVLGHAAANITQVYADRDYALAARVAKEVG